MSDITLLGVRIHNRSRRQIRESIRIFFDKKTSHVVVTPNPEFLLAARVDPGFRHLLNRADLALADGTGLVLAALAKGHFLRRMTGSTFLSLLCTEAQKRHASVFLLGGGEGVARDAAALLGRKYPGMRLVGAESGGTIEKMADGQWRSEDTTLVEKIQKAKPDVLLVAFGQRKQEQWLRDHIALFPTLRIAVGIGGVLDFLSGRIPRAPLMFRLIGCEWLWRLALEPHRWRRIFRAVILFPLVFFYDDFIRTKKTSEATSVS